MLYGYTADKVRAIALTVDRHDHFTTDNDLLSAWLERPPARALDLARILRKAAQVDGIYTPMPRLRGIDAQRAGASVRRINGNPS